MGGVKQKDTEKKIFSVSFLKCIDNNDTVSDSFIWFHSKNETNKREVKLYFGNETILIGLINWNLSKRIFSFFLFSIPNYC